MKYYEFSIIASGLNSTDEHFESRFYEAGCNDATVSFQRGHVIIDFSREADTVHTAVSTALEQVRATGAHVERVEPDSLVSLSDIAERVGKTRQALSLIAKGERGAEFPSPVAKVTSSSPMWDWADVAEWFRRKGEIADDVAEKAQVVSRINKSLRSAA